MIRIENKHAGGNIHVVDILAGRIQLRQEIRDTMEWWFYWNFSAYAELELDREIIFEFLDGEVVGPWGPAVSADGVSWNWLGSDSLISRSSFRYRFTAGKRKLFFAFSLPYQLHHFERFCAHIATDSRVRRLLLTESEQLRPVPLLQIGNPNASAHILLTCRHHSCESTPSYLLEGLLEHYLSDHDSKLLQDYLIHYIPFIDIDGVENGDQGKSRAPHDHNRDYIQSPIYQSTSALIDYANQLNMIAGIDFHGPAKWGGRNDVPFCVKLESPHKEEIERLSGHLQRISAMNPGQHAIRSRAADDIDMGVEWNQPHGTNCSAFFARSGAKLAFTYEFPYFGEGEPAYIPENCKLFGTDFARALETYLYE